MTVRIGSLFSGIGGFELGLERAIPGAVTVWQCEQNNFCQQVLQKHWPGAKIYNDVRNINETVEPVDILCGGFPCQDISVAGKQRGIEHDTRSGLWWEMHRITRILQPRIIIMENVAAILSVGGRTVLGSLAEIGYDCEWTVILARQFGAPHIRKRWFAVAYPHSGNIKEHPGRGIQVEKKIQSSGFTGKDTGPGPNYWQGFPTQSPFHRRNDGVSHRVDRIKSLGNAIVPQCSEWVGRQIVQSGLLDDLLKGEQ